MCSLTEGRSTYEFPQPLLLQTKISQFVKCSSSCSQFLKFSSQRPHCLVIQWFKPKCTCKVCGSFAINSHSLNWNLTMWYVCSFLVCSFNLVSLWSTCWDTSQAAGNSTKSIFECAFVLWILRPCLEVVVYSHLLHFIFFSSRSLFSAWWAWYLDLALTKI